MARIKRVEAIDFPHHVIQRGNRRQDVFFKKDDKDQYLNILKLQCRLFKLEIWGYCLMDNHIHLIVVPRQRNALTQAIAEIHKLYTRYINFRKGWRGYLWQGRFKSYVLGSDYLLACMRYVERNPVRAGIVLKAEEYEYSSAAYHVKGKPDNVVSPSPLESKIKDWKRYLREPNTIKIMEELKAAEQTGRPLGSKEFINILEQKVGRILTKRKPGLKKR